MALTVVTHPAVADALGRLRDAATPTGEFRAQMGRMAAVLVTEATATLARPPQHLAVPGAFTDVEVRAYDQPVLVPVLRAGAAMLNGALMVWPDATVGFLGLARDEATLTSSVYLSRLGDVAGRDVVVLEPMLATGGSLSEALALIAEAGRPASITVVGVVAAPEGVAVVEAAWPEVHLVFAALDERLTTHGFIYPGLGDAGDRAWGA